MKRYLFLSLFLLTLLAPATPYRISIMISNAAGIPLPPGWPFTDSWHTGGGLWESPGFMTYTVPVSNL